MCCAGRRCAARARRMFEEINRATPEAATCEDSLLADLGPYYEALGELLQRGFTAEERKEEDVFRRGVFRRR